ncbi:MAG: WS/DGAT domain-containing protein [Nevskia sp.]|nr:WS/DGAT domain-containing protein [Nevskia sp.]
MTNAAGSGRKARAPRPGRERPALAAGELMHSIDRAWLEMDRPRNPMVVSGLFQVDGNVTPLRFKRTLAERLLRFPRFSQRPERHHSPPLWVTETELDLDYHIHIRRLPAAGFEPALRKAVSAELTGELDPCRPLWRAMIFTRKGRPVMVMFRAHHAVADGIALLRVLLACTDAAMRRRGPAVPAATGHPRHDGPLAPVIDRLEGANAALEVLHDLVAEDLKHPGELIRHLRQGRDALGAIAHILQLPNDNPPELRLPLTGKRSLVWASDFRSTAIRRAAHARGVKINDLLMAALAGAFGSYLRGEGVAVAPEQSLRVSIPVNLRDDHLHGELGNCFGLVLLDLPVGMTDAAARLALVAERMNRLKTSGEARATLLALAAVGHLPMALEKGLVQHVADKSCAVVSNLRGPQRSVRIGGARLSNLVFWPPQSGHIGIGVSLISYAGALSVGISADTGVVKQPQRLLDELVKALRELGCKGSLRRAGA